jgi:hypothetical protein
VRNFALLAIVVYFGISILASIQPEWFEFVEGIPGRDKLLHFIGAGLLSFFVVSGISSVVVRNRTYGPFAMLAAITLLITFEEIGQLAIPSRTFDLPDLGWSYAGIAVFALPAIWLRKIQEPAG